MSRLVALDLPAGGAFVNALRRAWDVGDAVLPIDPRLPEAARRSLVETLVPAAIVDPTGEQPLHGGVPVEQGDAVVVLSSGSGGVARAAVHTHESLRAGARITSDRLGVDPEHDRWLACLPLAHVGGLGVVLRALLTETPLTVLPGFDAHEVLRHAEAGATLVSLVPAAYARLGAAPFRSVLLGGASPPSELPANVVVTYGTTETGGGVVYDGSPLEGVEVHLGPGEEILVSSPTLARCYRGPEGREEPVAGKGGWYGTGDIGFWDGESPERRLRVLGRRDEMINTGGEKVWPDEVEALLAACPGVAEVAVAGRPDPEWGQRVVAYVVPSDPGDPPLLEELRAAVAGQKGRWASPRELVLLDRLPRTGVGKVRRRDLPL